MEESKDQRVRERDPQIREPKTKRREIKNDPQIRESREKPRENQKFRGESFRENFLSGTRHRLFILYGCLIGYEHMKKIKVVLGNMVRRTIETQLE